jgi:hypothetical protein
VLEIRLDLVLELFAIDGAPSSPSARWVSALNHEIRDHSVEYDSVVVSALGEGSKVLASLRGMFFVELDDDEALKEVRLSLLKSQIG